MNVLHIILFLSSCFLFSTPYESYLKFLEKHPVPLGSYQAGEIEIIKDPSMIASIEAIQKARLLKNGFSETQAHEFSRVGIVTEDQYWIWVRDAVIFPKGAKGTYDRLLLKSGLQEPAGVAVLPLLPNGKIVLNLNFRHATRSWELELPRGGKKEKESIEAAALRELREETGLESATPIYLGSITPDSGVLHSIIPVFLGKIVKEGGSDQEFSEAIKETIAFSKDEIKKGLEQGFLNVEDKPVPLRDSFLAFALLQAEIRELL